MPRRKLLMATTDRWLEQDRGLKVLAVAIAVLLWLQAVADRNPIEERNFTGLPVKYSDPPPGLVVVSREPLSVNLTARGRSGILQHVTREEFKVYVDLSGAGPGLGEYEILISPPRGVEVAQVSMELATVRVDRLVTRQVPLRVAFRGEVATGHALGGHEVATSRVTVSGAESRVELATQAVAEVDVSGAAADLRRQVPVQVLAASGDRLGQVTASPAVVEVVVQVVRLPDAVMVPVDVQLEGVPHPGFVVAGVSVTPAEVAVVAQPGALQVMRWINTAPVVVEGRRETFTQSVPLQLVEGVHLIDPPRVTVTVQVRPTGEFRVFEGVAVEVHHQPAHLRARTIPDRVKVTVRGSPEALAALSPAKVTAAVDVGDRSAGSYVLPVRVGVPSGLTAESVEPAEVTVELVSP